MILLIITCKINIKAVINPKISLCFLIKYLRLKARNIIFK
ncbi:hypothetical protein EU96_1723 [Prochlorococcus marinus str. MIT 9302]|uniref:Uncharacterized protein n=1 Tax=Prochlorococcus marinus str. MIT 9302 TaxID=74545 RepID=A0A0A2A5D8_PROMR|nr:hypothetical protein EU96_1723 [Prochlorococcus marinus str. MIT 9302]